MEAADIRSFSDISEEMCHRDYRWGQSFAETKDRGVVEENEHLGRQIVALVSQVAAHPCILRYSASASASQSGQNSHVE